MPAFRIIGQAFFVEGVDEIAHAPNEAAARESVKAMFTEVARLQGFTLSEFKVENVKQLDAPFKIGDVS